MNGDESEVLVRVREILGEIARISVFIEGISSERELVRDEKTLYATIRSLEVIGEATKRIGRKFRNRFPGVAWQDMAGMRDKLIHDYGGINFKVVWETVKKDLPELKGQLEEITGEGKKQV